MELTLWSLLPLVPLGLLAGLLSGLLGIGGGLIFSPLLLLLGLDPHQALATSSLAIVPTTLGGTWSHLRSRSLPLGPSLAIALGAASSSALFSHLGRSAHGALLLGLQAAM
ncbi:MAG: sulfite exporter TauE/SafE family protein, partial [Cyanobacteria bacterium M_surface_9_m1_291]|nr:sulfite exporter TauE/SafE family protein [Cyanobacteria bacterium M_surface_9_m1_291]